MAKSIDQATVQVIKEGMNGLTSDTSETYERLDLQIRSLEAMARETFQYQFRRAYQSVVEKLEKGDELTDADKKLLAELIIADAKGYVKYEKDYESWKDDIQRLLSDLKALQDKGIKTPDDLLHLQAICRDLRAVLPDIAFYLRERERIQGYERNDIQALSPELKKLLAGIIKAMMASDKM